MRYTKPTIQHTTTASSCIQGGSKGVAIPDNQGQSPNHTPASAYEADE
ncbi:MAG TPA: hypothetical protein VGI45_24190 [Terracidiphilus sp.]